MLKMPPSCLSVTDGKVNKDQLIRCTKEELDKIKEEAGSAYDATCEDYARRIKMTARGSDGLTIMRKGSIKPEIFKKYERLMESTKRLAKMTGGTRRRRRAHTRGKKQGRSRKN